MIFVPLTSENARVTYMLAQFISDPFRNEPRNVGVIVQKNQSVVARFIGESDEGNWDSQRLRTVRNSSAYKLWVDRWRKLMSRTEIRTLTKSGSQTYRIIPGGGVAETGDDSAVDVCQYLFELLVSSGGLSAALGETDDSSQLSLNILATFRDLGLMAGSRNVINPIYRNQSVLGKSRAYDVAFTQGNENVQQIIEPVDFAQTRKIVARDRAAFLQIMFDDITAAAPDTKKFAIIRMKPDDRSDRNVRDGVSFLENHCRIVDWGNPETRSAFITHLSEFARSA